MKNIFKSSHRGGRIPIQILWKFIEWNFFVNMVLKMMHLFRIQDVLAFCHMFLIVVAGHFRDRLGNQNKIKTQNKSCLENLLWLPTLKRMFIWLRLSWWLSVTISLTERPLIAWVWSRDLDTDLSLVIRQRLTSLRNRELESGDHHSIIRLNHHLLRYNKTALSSKAECHYLTIPFWVLTVSRYI